MEEIKAFWSFETAKFKRALLGLFVLAAFVAILELLAIALLFPLLALITNPEQARIPAVLARVWAVQSPTGAVGALIAVFAGLYIVKAAAQTIYYRLQTSLVAEAQAALGMRLLRGYMSATYLSHLGRNASEVTRTITVLAQDVYGRFLNALLTMVADLAAAIVLIALSILAAPLPALAAGALILTIHTTQHRILRKLHLKLGREHVALLADELALVTDSLKLFRETRITGREGFLVEEFRHLQRSMAANSSRTEFLKRVPTAVGDVAVVLSVAAAVLIILLTVDNLGALTVTLGLLVAIAFRLSPVANRLVLSAGTINHSREAIFTLSQELQELDRGKAKRAASGGSFQNHVSLVDVSFCYPTRNAPALRNVSLRLEKGELLGIAGPSGAGKSTLIDVLLGLLQPNSGSIAVDGQEVGADFHLKSAYVPQSIVLFNDTLLRNITFEMSSPEDAQQQVQKSIAMSGLLPLVDRLPGGLTSNVGDSGALLSGGERQRVGLARALYAAPELLVLDEPTSALDRETEMHIINSLELMRGTVTTVVVSHSESVLRACDRVLWLQDGKLEPAARPSSQHRATVGQ